MTQHMSLGNDDVFDEFLSQRGYDVPSEASDWQRDRQKKQCPDCGGLHEKAATECTVCGWMPKNEAG